MPLAPGQRSHTCGPKRRLCMHACMCVACMRACVAVCAACAHSKSMRRHAAAAATAGWGGLPITALKWASTRPLRVCTAFLVRMYRSIALITAGRLCARRMTLSKALPIRVKGWAAVGQPARCSRACSSRCTIRACRCTALPMSVAWRSKRLSPTVADCPACLLLPHALQHCQSPHCALKKPNAWPADCETSASGPGWWRLPLRWPHQRCEEAGQPSTRRSPHDTSLAGFQPPGSSGQRAQTLQG